jgi:hypothetical protein
VKVALESIEKGRGDEYCIGCGCGCSCGDPAHFKRRTGLLEDFFILFRPGELVGSVADNARFIVCVPESIYISTMMYPTGEHAGCRPEDICSGLSLAWLNEINTAQIIKKLRLYVGVHPCLQKESCSVSHKLCLLSDLQNLPYFHSSCIPKRQLHATAS